MVNSKREDLPRRCGRYLGKQFFPEATCVTLGLIEAAVTPFILA